MNHLCQLLFIGVCLLFLLASWPQRLRDFSLEITGGRRPAALAVYWLVFSVALATCALLPGAAAHAIESRFKLTRRSWAEWMRDEIRAWSINLACGLVGIEILYGSIWLSGSWWWLMAGTAFVGITGFSSLLLPKRLIPMFNEVSELEPETAERLEMLCRRARIRLVNVTKVMVGAKTRHAEACVVGLGRRKTLILTDTLLQALKPEELDAIVAHELGHLAFHHLPKRTLMGGLTIVAGFYLTNQAFALGIVPLPTGVTGLADFGAAPAVLLVGVIATSLFRPLSLALSRQQERAADAFGWEIMGDSRPFIAAMQKLTRLNLFEYTTGVQGAFSHPATNARIAAAEKFMKERHPAVCITPIESNLGRV